jgi:hypothetical protein
MARNATKGAPVGRSGASYAGINPRVESEQPVLIVASNNDLAEFCDAMFGYIAGGVEAHGGTVNITNEQFRRYCVTALKVRVEEVIRSKWRRLGYEYTGMTVREGWAIPTPMQDVISSVGTTSIGTTDVSVYPVWDKTADELVLTKDERDIITRHLRSAASQLGIPLHAELSADKEGHRQTMVLVYLPDLQEWYAREPFAREDAAASLLSGATSIHSVVRGNGGADYVIVDTEQVATALSHLPYWMPDLRMERQVVLRYLPEMAALTK